VEGDFLRWWDYYYVASGNKITKGKSFDVYRNDKMIRFAVIKNIEILGEAAYLITKEFKTNHPSVEWEDMIGMCHISVYGYYQINDEIIWATIETELKPLKEKILLLLADY
jgi:uncharacterized protein with HEPN domain